MPYGRDNTVGLYRAMIAQRPQMYHQRGFWSRAGARRSRGALVQDLRNGHLEGIDQRIRHQHRVIHAVFLGKFELPLVAHDPIEIPPHVKNTRQVI